MKFKATIEFDHSELSSASLYEFFDVTIATELKRLGASNHTTRIESGFIDVDGPLKDVKAQVAACDSVRYLETLAGTPGVSGKVQEAVAKRIAKLAA